MRSGISWDYKPEQKFVANKLGGNEEFLGLELSWQGGHVLPSQWERTWPGYLEGQRYLVLLNTLGMQHQHTESWAPGRKAGLCDKD